MSASDIPSLTLSKISDVTASANELNTLDGITASTTELNYVDGVTSSIQTQLDNKVSYTNGTAVGSTSQPVYVDSNGVATAISYTIEKSVPSNALFTDTTYSDFTGADGTTAGTSGLVIAPAATDNTKFLKGDGTWATVDALPSQSGQSGKFLTTDGSSASWATINTDIDNESITLNVDDELQTVGIVEQNNGDVLYNWKGTLDEYNALQTYHNDWIYYITDDNWYITIDNALSTTSENPVQNKVVTNAINSKQDALPSGTTGYYLQKTANGVTWAAVSSSLGELSDVSLSSPTSGQNLTYNGSNWVNTTQYAMVITDYTA